MLKIPIPDYISRILKITTVLICVSTFTIIVMGRSLGQINDEVKGLNQFISSTQNVQVNFEKSLMLYTQNTKKTIDYVMKLRPATEPEFIKFISEIEQIGQKLSLNINLQSLDLNIPEPRNKGKTKDTLDYKISFFGSKNNLMDFMRELQKLEYLIKINELNYKDFKAVDYVYTDSRETNSNNIELNISLYVK